MSDSEGKRPREDRKTASRGKNPETAPPGEAVSGFPEPPGPGDPASDPDHEPHHELSNPVGDADPTEYPDPYETREDPRGPEAGERREDAGTPKPQSTSEPHPARDPDRERRERTSSKGAGKRDR